MLLLLFIFDVYLDLLMFFILLLLFFIHFQATFPRHRYSILASQIREGLQLLWALPRLLFDCLFFLIFRERYGFEWAFFTHTRFLLYLLPDSFGTTCFYQGLPGNRQVFLEVCRDSYWSSKHRPGPYVCLIHSNPQSLYILNLYLYMSILQAFTLECCFSFI